MQEFQPRNNLMDEEEMVTHFTEAINRTELAQLMDDKVDDMDVKGYIETLRKNIGRNDQCPCGSGKKFKKCHLGRISALNRSE